MRMLVPRQCLHLSQQLVHLVVKSGMRMLELGQTAEKLDLLNNIVDVGKNVVDVLRRLDKGCSRVVGRYSLLCLSAQMRLLKMLHQDGQLESEDLAKAVKEFTVARLRAT